MTNAIIEARFCWEVKLVRPVTIISCGGEWTMETKLWDPNLNYRQDRCMLSLSCGFALRSLSVLAMRRVSGRHIETALEVQGPFDGAN